MKEIVFTLCDEETGGVAIHYYEDGKLAGQWQENSWGYIDQWLRFYAPLNQPVILRIKAE